MVDAEKVKESKKRGHRKKKFGDQESKVISFRIAKDTYDKNKEEIREKVNNLIELEVKKKKTSKANFTPPNKQDESSQVKPSITNHQVSKGLDGYYSKKRDIVRNMQHTQEKKLTVVKY